MTSTRQSRTWEGPLRVGRGVSTGPKATEGEMFCVLCVMHDTLHNPAEMHGHTPPPAPTTGAPRAAGEGQEGEAEWWGGWEGGKAQRGDSLLKAEIMP